MIISEGIIYGCLAAIGCFLTTGILLFFAWIRTVCIRRPLQQEDIFNISSRVQGQETEWNTRDLTHVTISQHMHKPPYDDAPPSYEEAMRLAMAASLETSNGNNNSHSSSVQIQSVVVEEPKPVSSTSTSN